LGALVPKDAALFLAAAIAGAAAKSVTAPLDRIKLLMQVRIRFVFFIAVFADKLVSESSVNTTLAIL